MHNDGGVMHGCTFLPDVWLVATLLGACLCLFGNENTLSPVTQRRMAVCKGFSNKLPTAYSSFLWVAVLENVTDFGLSHLAAVGCGAQLKSLFLSSKCVDMSIACR